MLNKPKLLYIHGGTTFKNQKDFLSFLKNRTINLDVYKKWSEEFLDKKLGKKFQIIRPNMPLKENAQYEHWKIHFEKYLPLLGKNFVLIGYSLGGIFLAKYLSENKLKNKADKVFLVAPPYDNKLDGEDLVGGFKLGKDLSLIEKNTKDLYLLFSEDDSLVTLVHADKYRKHFSDDKIFILKNMNGHFRVGELKEILRFFK